MQIRVCSQKIRVNDVQNSILEFSAAKVMRSYDGCVAITFSCLLVRVKSKNDEKASFTFCTLGLFNVLSSLLSPLSSLLSPLLWTSALLYCDLPFCGPHWRRVVVGPAGEIKVER